MLLPHLQKHSQTHDTGGGGRFRSSRSFCWSLTVISKIGLVILAKPNVLLMSVSLYHCTHIYTQTNCNIMWRNAEFALWVWNVQMLKHLNKLWLEKSCFPSHQVLNLKLLKFTLPYTCSEVVVFIHRYFYRGGLSCSASSVQSGCCFNRIVQVLPYKHRHFFFLKQKALY